MMFNSAGFENFFASNTSLSGSSLRYPVVVLGNFSLLLIFFLFLYYVASYKLKKLKAKSDKVKMYGYF